MAIKIDGAIFLHIPKTGGTWVTHYLKESNPSAKDFGRAHLNGGELPKKIREIVFCFVRHPLTWYRSYWETKRAVSVRNGGYLDTIVDQPFDSFVGTAVREKPGYLSGFYRGYTGHSNFVGKQENLREDLDKVLSLLGKPYNRSLIFGREKQNAIKSQEKYPLGLALRVMETEKEIVDRYGYDYIPLDVLKEYR